MKIGVVAPGGRLSPEIPAKLSALAEAAFPDRRPDIQFHPQCFESSGHFAGDDAARARAFLEIANDAAIDAVWMGRGGYGSFRLIETVLPRLAAPARAKIYLGYSDAGALLGALFGAGIGRVAHGPMPADITRAGGEAAVRRALAFLIESDTDALEPSVAPGTPTAAFNITILAHLIGTPYLPDLAGHVLMLEEVAEPMYRIDRALGQIASAPALRRVAGIRLGRCGDIPANDPDFGQGEEEMARFWCERAGIPYLGRADIGHDTANKVVPFGLWRP
ncbi:MAG: LD-carboxypeptidase [Rhodospirillales bacterium]|nr:LD-carboxypeptidase [Rhodospirillales bacterium]